MKKYKKLINEYRRFYNRGFVGSMETAIKHHKRNDYIDYLRFIEALSDVTNAKYIDMIVSNSEVIRVIIKAFKFNLI